MFTPQLPTDNLYKFVAIAGLVAIVAAAFVPMRYVDNINTELHQIAVERYELYRAINELEDPFFWNASDMSLADCESPEWVRDEKSQYKMIDAFYKIEERLKEWIGLEILIHDIKDGKEKNEFLAGKSVRDKIMLVRDVTRAEYDTWAGSVSLEELRNTLKPRIQLAKAALFQLYRQRQATERIWDLVSERNHYEQAGFVGMMIGFVCIGFGFSMWYIKLQRHQDKLLLAELAAKKRAESQQK